MNIEKQAVYKIAQMVSKCSHLEPEIDTNDKTLLTDGHIDIHSSAEHSKESFEGRISVQVKGRKISKGVKIPLTFAIKKIDLQGYLKNNGVLYFVVFIDPKTDEQIPKYALLSPFKIQYFLKSMGQQKQFGVKLRPLPSDPSAIEGIVKLSLQSMNENPSARIDSTQLKELTSVTVYTDGVLNLDAPVRLTRADHDYSLVFETLGGMVLAVDKELVITPSEYIGEATTLTVTCGDFTFKNPTRRKVEKDTVEFEFSENLRMQKSDAAEGSVGSLSLTMSKTLSNRFADLGFYLACADNQAFSVDDVENVVQASPSKDLQEIREHFEYLSTLISLCKHLGVDASLVELGPLEGRRGEQLVDLYGVMLEGKQVTIQYDGTAGRILQPMGQWSLQLLVTQNSTTGEWECSDLFQPQLQQQFVASGTNETGDSQIDRVTPYDILENKHFPFTLNLHLDNIVNAYEEIAEYPATASYANLTVLKLISAADTVEARRIEFLDAALSLNSWLVSKSGKLPDHQINHLQIIARKSELTKDQRLEARSLKSLASRKEIDSPIQVETACAILLGDHEEIEYCLDRMNEVERTAFQDWPIWDLYNASSPERE